MMVDQKRSDHLPAHQERSTGCAFRALRAHRASQESVLAHEAVVGTGRTDSDAGPWFCSLQAVLQCGAGRHGCHGLEPVSAVVSVEHGYGALRH